MVTLAPSFLNRCAWRASSGGTGTFTFSSAKPGFYAPADCANPSVSDATYNYFAVSSDGSQHEEGSGVWNTSTGTLTRATIQNSTNAGAAVNFSAAPTVFMGNGDANSIAVPPMGSFDITANVPGSSVYFMGPYLLKSQHGFVDSFNDIYYTSNGPWVATNIDLDASTAFNGMGSVTDVTLDIVAMAGFQFQLAFTSATTINLPNLELSYPEVRFWNCDALITCNLPKLKATMGGITCRSISATSMLLPELEFMAFGEIEVSSAPSMATIYAPKLRIGSLSLYESGALTDLDMPLLEQGGVDAYACTLLTEISFPSYTGGPVPDNHYMYIDSCPALDTFDLPNAVYLDLYIYNCPLTEIIMPNLLSGDIDFEENPALTTVSYPAFTGYDYGDFNNGDDIYFYDNPALTLIEFGPIDTWASIYVDTSTALVTMDLSQATKLAQLIMYDVGSLTTCDLSSIEQIRGSQSLEIHGTALTNFTLPTSLVFVQGDVLVEGSLSQASVDNILVRLAALDGTGGTTVYSGHGVSIGGTSAAPSATGLAAAATLTARGCLVGHN